MNSVFNFSAGPAVLPHTVLEQAQQELCNWQGLGVSVMEVSHRGKEYMAFAAQAERDLRDLLLIPDNYKVLFCQGGARGQFMAVPLNLLGEKKQADYVVSGYWSACAADEADRVCQANRVNISVEKEGMHAVLSPSEWQLSDDSAYVHYCANESIEGVEIFDDPHFKNKIVVADMSSCILSGPIDVSRYGVIYAGAQKNMGPSGLTIVIVREDLLGYASKALPSILDYDVLAKNDSMFNTPPTFAWYLSGLVFKWLKAQGGLSVMAQRNHQKANLLYDFIDQSDFYHNNVMIQNRSIMNVPFLLTDSQLNTSFLAEANTIGLMGLKGHRIVGGMRASLYNAMTLEGVAALVAFMKDFERRYG